MGNLIGGLIGLLIDNLIGAFVLGLKLKCTIQ